MKRLLGGNTKQLSSQGKRLYSGSEKDRDWIVAKSASLEEERSKR